MKLLRDYQVDSIAGIRAAFEHTDSTLLVLATGLGKTVIFAKLANEWDRGNVLVLAHRQELIDQACDKLGDELGYEPPVEKAERSVDLECVWSGGHVIVGSVQTMRNERRLEKFRNHPFGLIVIDEAHHATASSYRVIIEFFKSINPSCKVLGVTATPRRTDDAALGIVFEPAPADEHGESSHGGAAYRMDIVDAIPQGWLTPIEQEFVWVEEINFQMGSKPNEMGESDLDRSELETILTEEKAMHAMAGPVLEKAGSVPTLVFCAGVAHAHMFAQVLNRYRDGSAAAVDGKTLKTERQTIVSRFKRGELQFLCNYGVFTEGFDAPVTGMIVMARPTKSVGLYTQMLGRGTRPLDGILEGKMTPEDRQHAIAMSGKPLVRVLDFVGNSRHKLVSSLDVLGGEFDHEVKELAKQKLGKKPGDPTKAMQEAKQQILSEQEAKRRSTILATTKAQYETRDPFGHDEGASSQSVEVTRGGSSDAQIGFLVNLGVTRERAAKYTKRQASAVIEAMKSTRCTQKQFNALKRSRLIDSANELSVDAASKLMDALAKAHWTATDDVRRLACDLKAQHNDDGLGSDDDNVDDNGMPY